MIKDFQLNQSLCSTVSRRCFVSRQRIAGVVLATAISLCAVPAMSTDEATPSQQQAQGAPVPSQQQAQTDTEDTETESESGGGGYGGGSSGGIWPLGDETSSSRLSDEPTKFLTVGDIPERPALLFEFGDAFLGTGNLAAGFELPTGAVWQPRLWIFGTLRTAVQTIDTGTADRVSEWANRFDLFANLQLTGTEKIVLGIRPFDKNRPGQFSGYTFEPDSIDGFNNFTNANIRTLFAEGDFGSLFPNLDPQGTTLLDFGFSVGRQPLIFQDGILLNDTIDAVGLVRNNVRFPGVSNARISATWGWNEVSRTSAGLPSTSEQSEAQLFGLFTSFDTPKSTINADVAYVLDDIDPDGDGLYGGVSAAQRIGKFNTTFRVNGSLAIDEDTPLVTDGALFSAELSWTPYRSDDTIYINPFATVGTFTQAGREPIDGGGPLAPLGILFASPNIGAFGSEINNRANDVAGFAIGYQAFWDDHRRNLAIELAGRKDLGLDEETDSVDQLALGFQLQQKIHQQALIQLEGFIAAQEDLDDAYGARLEFLYQF